jgi:hypothetical protein
MKRWVARITIILAAGALAGPASDWLGLRSLGAWLSPPAAAIIGRPLTPVSVAGVARRTVRRTAVGSIVPALPVGCASVPAGGVVYYNCGGVFYKPHYQSANLVYVVVPAP